MIYDSNESNIHSTALQPAASSAPAPQGQLIQGPKNQLTSLPSASMKVPKLVLDNFSGDTIGLAAVVQSFCGKKRSTSC